MRPDIADLISKMTLEEKAGCCSFLNVKYTRPVERLGIPKIKVADGPVGYRLQEGDGEPGIYPALPMVCFPAPCLLACSFDPGLLEEMGELFGSELREKKVGMIYAPALNIKRNPLCGRNFEYYSEDPHLSGEIALGIVKGLEKTGVCAMVKHYALNNCENYRLINESVADERAVREIYLSGFEKVVKDGKPRGVMASYNMFGGKFVTENKWLLQDVLRGEWGFDGMIQSDYGAVSDRVEALKGGTDLECPPMYDEEIVAAVKDGSLDIKVVDEAVRRNLQVIFDEAELFKQDFACDRDAHHEFVVRAAAESMVLLKNENSLLPFSKKDKIAVIGAFAEKPRIEGAGSSFVNPYKLDRPLDSLKEEGISFEYAKGYEMSGKENEELIEEAVKIAGQAEKCLVFIGLPDNYESEGYDRDDMLLPQNQLALMEKLTAANKNIAAVMLTGSPVEIPFIDKISALLYAYLPGQGIGRSVNKIIFGEISPSGKLAESLPVNTPTYPLSISTKGAARPTTPRASS